MDDNDNVNQSGCCDDGHCCPPTPGGESRRPGRWKTLIFSGVILLACAVAAYSLYWRSDKTAASACCPPGSPAAAACGQTATNTGFDHAAARVGLSLVVLTKTGEALSREKLAIIGGVRASLESHDAQLHFETIESADTAFLKLVNQHRITTFPTVIVSGQDEVLVLSESQVSADTILSVFKPTPVATAPDSASKSGSL